jgi:hypothetical protein
LQVKKVLKLWVVLGLVLLFFVAGFLVMLHQYFTIGVWFQVEDVHHETAAIAAFVLGVGVLIGASLVAKE